MKKFKLISAMVLLSSILASLAGWAEGSVGNQIRALKDLREAYLSLTNSVSKEDLIEYEEIAAISAIYTYWAKDWSEDVVVVDGMEKTAHEMAAECREGKQKKLNNLNLRLLSGQKKHLNEYISKLERAIIGLCNGADGLDYAINKYSKNKVRRKAQTKVNTSVKPAAQPIAEPISPSSSGANSRSAASQPKAQAPVAYTVALLQKQFHGFEALYPHFAAMNALLKLKQKYNLDSDEIAQAKLKRINAIEKNFIDELISNKRNNVNDSWIAGDAAPDLSLLLSRQNPDNAILLKHRNGFMRDQLNDLYRFFKMSSSEKALLPGARSY